MTAALVEAANRIGLQAAPGLAESWQNAADEWLLSPAALRCLAIGIVLATLTIAWWLGSRRRARSSSTEASDAEQSGTPVTPLERERVEVSLMPSFNQTPDEPEPFGYKISWFAVKACGSASVVEAFELGEPTPANWASGLAVAYAGSNPWLFVSPPVNGWILVVSSSLPYPTGEAHHDIGRKFDVVFSRLMKRFDEVQFFGSHRVSGFAAWARAENGKPMRIFAYADGQVLMNVGDQTSEEAKLGLANLTGLSPADAEDKMYRLAEELDAEADRLVANGLSRREALARVRQDGDHPDRHRRQS